MPYYPTIAEDLKAAEEILKRGDARREFVQDFPAVTNADRDALMKLAGGTIYGADTYAAYKLLESFVKEIPRLNEELLAMHEEAVQYETELNRLKANPMTRMHNLVDGLQACDRCGESPTETEGEPCIYCEKCDAAMKADQQMLATVVRNTVLALADVPDDWEGSVAEGVALINANLATAHDHLENYQLLLALMGVEDYKSAVRAWKAMKADRGHIDRANDAVQDWVNANPSLVPEGLDQLLSELDVVINGK